MEVAAIVISIEIQAMMKLETAPVSVVELEIKVALAVVFVWW